MTRTLLICRWCEEALHRVLITGTSSWLDDQGYAYCVHGYEAGMRKKRHEPAQIRVHPR